MEKKVSPEQIKKNLRYQRDKDRQKVKGIFRFHEVPGGTLSFVFHKYNEDPVENFTLRDGEVYEIPLGVARHLNKNCSYPEHTRTVDMHGKPLAVVGKTIRRCSFQSLEFVDIDDITPDGQAADIVNK